MKRHVKELLWECYRQHRRGRPQTPEALYKAVSRYTGPSDAVDRVLLSWFSFCEVYANNLKELGLVTEEDVEECWQLIVKRLKNPQRTTR